MLTLQILGYHCDNNGLLQTMPGMIHHFYFSWNKLNLAPNLITKGFSKSSVSDYRPSLFNKMYPELKEEQDYSVPLRRHTRTLKRDLMLLGQSCSMWQSLVVFCT